MKSMKQENNDWIKDIMGRVESTPFSEDYWHSLEKKLDKKKEKRKVLAFMFFILVIVSFAAIISLKWNGHKDELARSVSGSKLAGIGPVQHRVHGRQDDERPERKTSIKSPEKTGISEKWPIEIQPKSDGLNLAAPVEMPEKMNDQLSLMPLQGLYVPSGYDSITYIISGLPEIKYRHLSKGKLSFDFAVGMQSISGNIQSSTPGESNYTFNRRKYEESQRFFVSPVIGLSYRHKSGLLMSLSIEYARYGEQINYRPYSMQQDVIKNFNYVYDSVPVYSFATRSTRWANDTNLYISYDTATREKTDKAIRNHRKNTSVAYVEIPVLFGYEWNNRNYGLSLKSGLSFGYLRQGSLKGQYLNTVGTGLTDLSSEKRNFSTVITNYHLQFRLSRKIHQHLAFYIEPSMKINLNPVYSDGFMSKRYNAFGSYVGLTYLLN
jgi:hypothetical protein